jgi:hypothetical protein
VVCQLSIDPVVLLFLHAFPTAGFSKKPGREPNPVVGLNAPVHILAQIAINKVAES